mmetsp:Transcript_23897/g.59786  ORF Transcript_23897/g.59786 Transcript_23897/m.59786 type:complete len:424 (-) Transcript_23897:51-1322(-)
MTQTLEIPPATSAGSSPRLVLPYIRSKSHYKSVITDVPFWKGHLRALCKAHSLPLTPNSVIRSPVPIGTHPVFIIDESYVIKLFCHARQGAATFVIELYLAQLLATTDLTVLPRKIAVGKLHDFEPYFNPEDDLHKEMMVASENCKHPADSYYFDPAWDWPFIVTNFMAGVPLQVLRKDLTVSELGAVMLQFGGILARLHNITAKDIDLDPPPRVLPDFFRDFISKRKEDLPATLQKWKSMPAAMWPAAIAYIPENMDDIVDLDAARFVFLHTDAHEDHILIDPSTHAVTGLIDFGDAMLGPPIYEFIAVHICALRCDKGLLVDLLLGYTMARPPPGVGNLSLEQARHIVCSTPLGMPMPVFVRHCMHLVLLNEFNRLNTAEEGYQIDFSRISSMDDLATRMWDLSRLDLVLPIILCDAAVTF